MRCAEAYAKGAVQKERTGIEKSQDRVEKILARTRRRCPSISGLISARTRGEVLTLGDITHHRFDTPGKIRDTCPGHPHHHPARASTTPSPSAPRARGGGGGEEVGAAPASRGCPAPSRRPSPRAAPLRDRAGSRGQSVSEERSRAKGPHFAPPLNSKTNKGSHVWLAAQYSAEKCSPLSTAENALAF